MKEITIKNIDNTKLEELSFGSLYFIFSSLESSKFVVYKQQTTASSFINFSFEEAIKIPQYIMDRKITQSQINFLKEKFNIPFLNIDAIGIYNQMVFVMLSELLEKEIVFIETTGLAGHSIKYLLEFCYKFLKVNLNKLIIVVHLEMGRLKYPSFQLEKIDQKKISTFDNWIQDVAK